MRALFLVLALLAARPAEAAQSMAGRLGAGAILGVPFGATGKFWVDDKYAVQAAVGVSDGDLSVSADWLRHFDDVLPRRRAGRLPLYAGLGLKLKSESSTFAGFRLVGGVEFFHATEPYSFFAEIAPVIRFAPKEGGAMDGAVGVRYWFR